ncbi:MAG: hypothetical protein V8R80_12260 [Eubacterium sp.]
MDITARPLVINCDYRDAVFRTTSNINGAIRGELSPDSLSELERVYYEACLNIGAAGGRRISGPHICPGSRQSGCWNRKISPM